MVNIRVSAEALTKGDRRAILSAPPDSARASMTDLLSLGATGLAFFVIAVSPGPATVSNAAIAMSKGRRISLIYGAGLSCGLIFWGLIAASGMGAVLQSSVYMLMALKLLGGLYLLWLALLSGRSAMRPTPAVAPSTGHERWFLRGLVLNMSNPKSVIAWMAALSISVNATADYSTVAAATLVCILVGFATNAAYSILFSINGMMRTYECFRRRIDGVVTALFSLAGFGLIRSAFTR